MNSNYTRGIEACLEFLRNELEATRFVSETDYNAERKKYARFLYTEFAHLKIGGSKNIADLRTKIDAHVNNKNSDDLRICELVASLKEVRNDICHSLNGIEPGKNQAAALGRIDAVLKRAKGE
jgi:hypothetical protein